MNITIRLATKKDLNKLAKIYVNSYSPLPTEEQWEEKTAKKLLSYWMIKQPDLFFVVEVNKKLAGAFVSGIKPWRDGNHLFDGEVFVDPKYQKLGAGSKLIKAVFTKAIKKYKAVTFEASTFKNTKFPLKWYKTMGILSNKELVFISGDLKNALKKLAKESL
jgi:GNAT superfamily N-acetyltransferase